MYIIVIIIILLPSKWVRNVKKFKLQKTMKPETPCKAKPRKVEIEKMNVAEIETDQPKRMTS